MSGDSTKHEKPNREYAQGMPKVHINLKMKTIRGMWWTIKNLEKEKKIITPSWILDAGKFVTSSNETACKIIS